jgi:hypothetical protein
VLSRNTIEDVSPGPEEILLLWQNSPTETFSLPLVAVVAEGTIPNFLAWVLTYFRHIRPFTAHCRVLTPSQVNLITKSVLLRSQQNVEAAVIGLILAEGIAYSVGRTDLNRLPFSAFSRTLSYAYAEGVKLYKQTFMESEKILEEIRGGWLSARKLSNQPSIDLSPCDIGEIWNLTMKAFAGAGSNLLETASESLIVKALQAMVVNGSVPRNIWSELCGRSERIEPLIESMEGPREERVKSAEIVIRECLNGRPETRRNRAFVAGYIVSLIQPGSLDHFSILFPAISELRESLLWYGVCSGLSPETSVDTYGNGLGLLLKREIGRSVHWLDRPKCDIALSEMEILLQSRDDTKLSLQTLTSGILKVEVFPLINTSVKYPVTKEDQSLSKDTLTCRQMSLFNEDARLRQYVFELLRKIDESAMSLNAIRKQVENKFGEKNTKARKGKK